jgi:plastocyanin
MTAFHRALGLAGAIAITAACGSAAAPAAPAATNAPAAAAAVSIDVQGFKFPASTDVAKGTKVTWTNRDGTGHTVTSGTPPTKDGKFDGPLSGGGGTFSFTFADAGTFAYFCTIHTTMVGTITVK